MRRLHPVSLREKFVASGTYHFYDSTDRLLPYEEHWSVHEVGEGAHFIRMDYDGRAENGPSVLMEALRTPDGAIERCDVRAYGGDSDAVRLLRASYTQSASGVMVQRFLDDVPGVERDEKPPYPDWSFVPAASFLLAWARYHQAQRGVTMPVFLSHNTQLSDDSAFDVKYHMYNHLTLKPQQVIVSGGKDYLATPLSYEDQAGHQHLEWFNQQGVLLKALAAPEGLRIELARYSGKA